MLSFIDLRCVQENVFAVYVGKICTGDDYDSWTQCVQFLKRLNQGFILVLDFDSRQLLGFKLVWSDHVGLWNDHRFEGFDQVLRHIEFAIVA